MKELKKLYVSSAEVRLALKCRPCDVMHLREAGKIKFVKKGNAFHYLWSDVEILVKDKLK